MPTKIERLPGQYASIKSFRREEEIERLPLIEEYQRRRSRTIVNCNFCDGGIDKSAARKTDP